jgi:predicted short-subunit dehydrogenase-like oxidoreductase (DUF2520 family)
MAAPAAKIFIVGTGNLAWHLAGQLIKKNRQVTAYARARHKRLAYFREAGITVVSGALNVPEGTDFCILCVPDDRIADIAKSIAISKNTILVHCSGSIGIKALPAGQPAAVMYPLQTFSATDPVDFSEVPVFTDGSTPAVRRTIDAFQFQQCALRSSLLGCGKEICALPTAANNENRG